MTAPKSPHSVVRQLPLAPLIGFAVGLLLLIIGSFAPDIRAWGFDWWAYLPHGLRWILAGSGILFAFASYFFFRPKSAGSHSEISRPCISMAILASLGLAGISVYMFFPAATHFLGDGYWLLQQLVDHRGGIKPWDIGASTLSQFIFSQVSGDRQVAALTAYRVVSFSAGALSVIGTAVASYRLFPSLPDRILFFLGLMTSGFCLLFFGYVEQYPMMVAGLLLFTLTGLGICLGTINKWWGLLPFTFAVLIHAYALVAAPGLLYLLLRDTAWPHRWSQLSRPLRLTLLVVGVGILVIVYQYLRSVSYFVVFGFLPILPDRFTVEGNWLFSPKHVADMLNLLFLLVPGVPILVVAFIGRGQKRRHPDAGLIFLVVTALSTLAAVFLISPRLGMARDWDLLSMTGVPLAVLSFYWLLTRHRNGRVAAGLAVSLGLLVLGPRVGVQTTPELAIAHLRTYFKIDFLANRPARIVLADYYHSIGDTVAAADEMTRYQRDFPSIQLNHLSFQAFSEGNLAEAASWARQSIASNPLQSDAWFNLGAAVLHQGKTESSIEYLQISDGLNPYSAPTKGALGFAFARFGDTAEAIRYETMALEIDSTDRTALSTLVLIQIARDNADVAFEYLERYHRCPNPTPGFFTLAADGFRRSGHDDYARRAEEWGQDLTRQ